jgi:hypothetical protein
MTVDSDGENISYQEMVNRAKSLKMSFGQDVQTNLTQVKLQQGTANTQASSHVKKNVALSKAVLEEARITREKMNKRIHACQLDFTYPPVCHTADSYSALELNSDRRRADYKTIFSEDELEHLGIVGKKEPNSASVFEAQRQPSCLLDKPLPSSRFSDPKASTERGRICAPTPPTMLDFVGSFNLLCCSSTRNTSADFKQPTAITSSGTDSDLEHRLRAWGSVFVPGADAHADLDGAVRRSIKADGLHRRTPSSMSAASTPPAGGRNSRRAEELFAATAPAPSIRGAAPTLGAFVSDDAADAAAAAAAAAAEIPDYDAENSEDGEYDSDEEGGTEEVWGEGYAAPSARGASPRHVVSPRLAAGGAGSGRPSGDGERRREGRRRVRDRAEADPEVCGAVCGAELECGAVYGATVQIGARGDMGKQRRGSSEAT